MLQESRVGRKPLDGYEKTVKASFKQVINNNFLQKGYVDECEYDDSKKVYRLVWSGVSRDCYAHRRVEVHISSKHAEVFAAAAMVVMENGKVLVLEKIDQVGDPVRFPLFTDALQRRIVEGYEIAEEFSNGELKPKEESYSKPNWVKSAISLVDIKDFVTGI